LPNVKSLRTPVSLFEETEMKKAFQALDPLVLEVTIRPTQHKATSTKTPDIEDAVRGS
jgi:hypothetical protein